MTTTRNPDKWNPSKIWIIKHYSCGHYTINQEIKGRLFYSRFHRVRKSHIDAIFSD